MASQLSAVLERFAVQSEPLSVAQMARDMKIDLGVLQGMIEYWVRKGRLRAVASGGGGCTSCGIKSACPFVVALPSAYELIRDDELPIAPACVCGCGGT